MAFPDHHLPLSFEPLSPMKDEIIVPDSDTEHEGYRSTAKRRRIEELGRHYIAGHEITIISARLKGPFDGNWRNPWHKRAAQHTSRSHLLPKKGKTVLGPKQREERHPLPSAALEDGGVLSKPGLEKRARALEADKKPSPLGAAVDCAGAKIGAVLRDGPKSRPANSEGMTPDAFIGNTNFQPQPEEENKLLKKSMKRRAESWLKAVKGSAYSKGGTASPPSPASDSVDSPSMFGLRDGQLSGKSGKPVAQALSRTQMGSLQADHVPDKPCGLTTVGESHRASERANVSLPTRDKQTASSEVKWDDLRQARPNNNHALEPGLIEEHQISSPRDDHLGFRPSPATLCPPSREATSEAAHDRDKAISAAVKSKEKVETQQLPHAQSWDDKQGPVALEGNLTDAQPAPTMLLNSRNSNVNSAGNREEVARVLRTTSSRPRSPSSDARPVATAAVTRLSPLHDGDALPLASGAEEHNANAATLRSSMNAVEDLPNNPIHIGHRLHPDHLDPARTPWPELSEPEQLGLELTPVIEAPKRKQTTAQERQSTPGGQAANGSEVREQQQEEEGLQALNKNVGMEDEPSISTQTALANMQLQFQADIQTPRTTAPKSPRTALTGQEADTAGDEENLISTQALFDAASPFALSTIKKKYRSSKHGQPIHLPEKAPLANPDRLAARPIAPPGKETLPVLNNQQSAVPAVNGVENTSDVAPLAVGASSNGSGVDDGEATKLETFSGSDIDAVMDDIRDTVLAKWDLDAELRKEAAGRTSPSTAAGGRGGSERLRSWGHASRARL